MFSDGNSWIQWKGSGHSKRPLDSKILHNFQPFVPCFLYNVTIKETVMRHLYALSMAVCLTCNTVWCVGYITVIQYWTVKWATALVEIRGESKKWYKFKICHPAFQPDLLEIWYRSSLNSLFWPAASQFEENLSLWNWIMLTLTWRWV